MKAEKDSIPAYRDEIDALDAELLRLLNRRTECALEIGRLKRQAQQPVHVPEREKAILERLTRLNAGPLPPDAVRRVFESIMAEMRRVEENSN